MQPPPPPLPAPPAARRLTPSPPPIAKCTLPRIRNGGIYRADGSPKTAATALYDMWHATWTTRVPARHVSLPAGRHTVRGFYGKYTWRAVLAGGQEAGGEVEFPAAAGEQQTVVLQL